MTPDTPHLIQRWQAGDERAAESLYSQYRDPLFRLAYGLLGVPADADEVAQDTLTYALCHIDRYDPHKASFTTWLHTIAVSRCRDKRRRKWLPRLSLAAWLGGGGDTADPSPTPERQAIASESHSELWQAVQSLSPTLREAILLRYWAGHTYRDMAAILGCPLPTAQSRVRLAYQELRATLTTHGFPHPEQETP
jgi:RNA polymerase sigma-70 factor (ECF subfamily)